MLSGFPLGNQVGNFGLSALGHEIELSSKLSLKLRRIAHVNPPKPDKNDYSSDMMISFIEMAAVSEDGFVKDMETEHPMRSAFGLVWMQIVDCTQNLDAMFLQILVFKSVAGTINPMNYSYIIFLAIIQKRIQLFLRRFRMQQIKQLIPVRICLFMERTLVMQLCFHILAIKVILMVMKDEVHRVILAECVDDAGYIRSHTSIRCCCDN